LKPQNLTIHSAAGIAYFALSVCPVWIPAPIGNAVEISWIALSVGTTTVSTIIIVICILLASRRSSISNQAHLAAEIITESAALYSISALIDVSLLPVSSSVPYTPGACYGDVFFAYLAVSSLSARPEHYILTTPSTLLSHLIVLQNFAPVFIMLRVTLGHAHPDTEWNEKISGLQFNSNLSGAQASVTERSKAQGTGDEFGTNTILMVPRSNFKHELDIDLEARDVGIDMDAVVWKGDLETSQQRK
jgi:hypothetical protein